MSEELYSDIRRAPGGGTGGEAPDDEALSACQARGKKLAE